MKKKVICCFLVASVTLIANLQTISNYPLLASALPSSVSITVNPDNVQRKISPYIYGINSGVDLNDITAKSYRLGGNRLTAYNWENNASNAGSDWKNYSDLYLVNNIPSDIASNPAAPAIYTSNQAVKYNIPYTLLTLQMQGYASADTKGEVITSDKAPSSRWVAVRNKKGNAFSLLPDTNDGAVYIDEYLNYLFSKIGNSKSKSGFNAYALDNEPSLWSETHSLIQPSKLMCSELVEKSISLAATIKEMDANADVFGASLYGYNAFVSFSDASDWKTIRKENNYNWFLDYYLDEMQKAETKYAKRLVDVLDLHYYSEAKGACGERFCNHYDRDECVLARLNSTRSLYEKGYKEDSWITDVGSRFMPIIPSVFESINSYYPGTKLAFSEYNFGGGDHISGAIAQADCLGVFAQYGVYFASLWAFEDNEYQLSAINLFTNYDGKGAGFGDSLVYSKSSNTPLVSSYAAIDSENTNTVKVILTNKSVNSSTPVSIKLDGAKVYDKVETYAILEGSPKITKLNLDATIKYNSLDIDLPALSVVELVISASGSSKPVTTSTTATATSVTTATSELSTSTTTTNLETTTTITTTSLEATTTTTSETTVLATSATTSTSSDNSPAENNRKFTFISAIVAIVGALAAIAFVIIKKRNKNSD